MENKKARISYMCYSYRYPRLIDYILNNEPQNEVHKIKFNEGSIHYKDWHLFDDMIKKINDEKEKWPPAININLGEML